MILINLLPQELRVVEKKKLELPIKPILISAVFVFLCFSIYNLFLFLHLREKYRVLEKQWAPLAQSSFLADQLERELGSTILVENQFYDTLVEPKLQTAQIMNAASDLIPGSLWLARLRFERQNQEIELVMNGLSEFGKSSRLVEIENFVYALRDFIEKIIGPSSGEQQSLETPSAVQSEALPPGFPTEAMQLPPGFPGGAMPGESLALPSPYLSGQKKVEVNVETSSKKSAESDKELVEFVATLKTPRFGAKESK
jgi:hypothetical protein